MRRKKGSYSKGELNRMVDAIIHPLFAHNPEMIIVDVFLHGLIERNPSETAVKFIRYSLPSILQKALNKGQTRNANARR